MEFANIIVYCQCHNFRYKLRGNNQDKGIFLEPTVVKVALLCRADNVAVGCVDFTEGAHLRRKTELKAIAGKIRVAVARVGACVCCLDVPEHGVIVVLNNLSRNLLVALYKEETTTHFNCFITYDL